MDELGMANLAYLSELGHDDRSRRDCLGRLGLLDDNLAGRVNE